MCSYIDLYVLHMYIRIHLIYYVCTPLFLLIWQKKMHGKNLRRKLAGRPSPRSPISSGSFQGLFLKHKYQSGTHTKRNRLEYVHIRLEDTYSKNPCTETFLCAFFSSELVEASNISTKVWWHLVLFANNMLRSIKKKDICIDRWQRQRTQGQRDRDATKRWRDSVDLVVAFVHKSGRDAKTCRFVFRFFGGRQPEGVSVWA